ncbi:MAG: hypothetical protein MMC33_004791 [Icmadophila ericetorum]|nr:hypothetical protein [Icmadophila ericetorum]
MDNADHDERLQLLSQLKALLVGQDCTPTTCALLWLSDLKALGDLVSMAQISPQSVQAMLRDLATTASLTKKWTQRYREPNSTDSTPSLNISASSSIKYGPIKGSGSAPFVNENKVSKADISYVITVKVAIEVSPIPKSMKFNLVKNLNPKKFTEAYGDYFISAFIEGGEFNAVITIKVNSKSKITTVKAAAEAEFAVPAASGLTADAQASLDKTKSHAWKDTETTITVNWSGGGFIKDPDKKWDLLIVNDVAVRFPHLAESCGQLTSAILTRCTSLRSFHDENMKLPTDNRFVIKNYELCSLYTTDLFYTIKHPELYRAKEKSELVPDRVETTPKSLNEARLEARKGLILITEETAKLVEELDLADVGLNGEMRSLPCDYPEELAMRLPATCYIDSDVDIEGSNQTPLTAEEMAVIGKWANLADIVFAPLSGTPRSPIRGCWANRCKDTIFCTLSKYENLDDQNLTKLRLHAHEHHPMDFGFDFKKHSKSSDGYLSGIGFSVSTDAGLQANADRTHRHLGKLSKDPKFWSNIADLSFQRVTKVIVVAMPGSGRISGLTLIDNQGAEAASWK